MVGEGEGYSVSDSALLLCIGYTCMCGERVTVFRVQMNQTASNRLLKKIVTCKNGHIRTVTVDQLVTLDHWVEEIEEQEFAAGA
jgi:hypothetical protein